MGPAEICDTFLVFFAAGLVATAGGSFTLLAVLLDLGLGDVLGDATYVSPASFLVHPSIHRKYFAFLRSCFGLDGELVARIERRRLTIWLCAQSTVWLGDPCLSARVGDWLMTAVEFARNLLVPACGLGLRQVLGCIGLAILAACSSPLRGRTQGTGGTTGSGGTTGIGGTTDSGGATGTVGTTGACLTSDAGGGQGTPVTVEVTCTDGTVHTLTEYPLPTTSCGPYCICAPQGITAGPDGNLWFTEQEGNNIGRITVGGIITEFAIPTANVVPDAITAGPDGNLWFTETAEQVPNSIGRITPGGKITEFPLPKAYTLPQGITTGADGNLWFTEEALDSIGRITPDGAISEFLLPNLLDSGHPSDTFLQGITAGPDGNIWFAEWYVYTIGQITPSGTITSFQLPPEPSGPSGITAGPDGNIWFIRDAGGTSVQVQIGRIALSGEAYAEFKVPAESWPETIVAGPDGNLWFGDCRSYGNNLRRISPDGKIVSCPLPTPDRRPCGITHGPDGNLWFIATGTRSIGRLVL